MSSRLIIKSHQPWRHRLKVVGGVLVSVLVLWGMFEYGFSRAGYDNASLLQEREAMQASLKAAEEESRRLSERISILERAAQVDQQAYAQVEESLKQAQDEMLELKEEVAFYRGIVSPSETASGLAVTRFQLENIGEAHTYRFKLVLSQLKTNNRVVKGYARVAFDGVMAGEQKQLGLKELSRGKLDRLKLRFKYFQDIEGDVVLPQDFLPSRVLVEVVPTGKNATRLKKSFDWSDIIKQ
jgi:hypothetical protein